MRWLTKVRLRLRSLFRRALVDRELDEEVRFFVERRTEEHVAAGMDPAEARAAALQWMGSMIRLKETVRETRGLTSIEDLVQDMRYGLRTLARSPGFTFAAVVTLALGIGATTAVFSLVNAVLLRPLPFPDGDRLVAAWFTPSNQSGQKTGTNPLGYFTIRDNNQVFERVGAVRLTAAFNVGEDSPSGDSRIRVPAQWFTFGLIPVLGVNPVIGRWPTPEDTSVIVISDGLWQRLFGGSPDVLGKKLRIDAFEMTVIGVMPADFELISPADFWLFQTDAELRTALRGSNRIYSLIARLKPGVTVDQAQDEMARFATVLAEEMPETHKGWSIQVETLRDVRVGEIRKPLLVFQGAVLFVLLIACANVAGLLVAQASTRHRELALRVALGARRGHLVRQLLTESVVLAVLGGVLGVALCWVGLYLFTNWSSWGLPASTEVSLDVVVLGFTLLICLASGVMFGVLPALLVSRPNVMGILTDSTRSATAGTARQRLRSAFVTFQVALALVLLIGAGLMINSFLRLVTVQAGFDSRQLITFQVPFPRSFYTWDGNTSYEVELGPRIDRVSEAIRERILAIPGVEAAALTVTPPLGGEPPHMNFTREGRPVASFEEQAWSAEWYPIGAGYFQTLKIPLLKGRDFLAADMQNARPVAIVNATLAQQYWPGEDPIGQRIQLELRGDPPREIVGIVGDVRQNRYQRDLAPQLYVPRPQLPRTMAMILSQQIMLVNTFVARLSGDAKAVTPALRAAVAEVDPTQVIVNVRTVEEYAAGQLDDVRAYASLLTTFSVVSLVLVVVGIYGVVAHLVSQRSKEIGIRMALGARAGTAIRLVLRQGLLMVVSGLVLGTVASFALTRVIQSLLWGVRPTDPLTFIVVLVTLSVIGLLACLVPARRASRVDPLIVLKD
jgi:putative ABC transport system permease protein